MLDFHWLFIRNVKLWRKQYRVHMYILKYANLYIRKLYHINIEINSMITERCITYAELAIGCINIFTRIITTLYMIYYTTFLRDTAH